jgi:hypothetical protein
MIIKQILKSLFSALKSKSLGFLNIQDVETEIEQEVAQIMKLYLGASGAKTFSVLQKVENRLRDAQCKPLLKAILIDKLPF